MIRETSIKTYNELIEAKILGYMQEKVLDAIIYLNKISGSPTDMEIVRYLGYFDPNKVRPRRKELLDKGIILDCGTRMCTITLREAHVWAFNNKLDFKKPKKIIKSKCQFCNGRGYLVKKN